MSKTNSTIAERPTLDAANAVQSPRSFVALANGGKLEGESLSGIVSIGSDGLALETTGRIAQAVSAYVWTASKTGTMKEWADAVGVARFNASNASQLSAAGKALVTIELPQGITAQMVVSAANQDSKGVREANSKTKLAQVVRAALAAKDKGRRANPTGGKEGLSVTPEEATPESSKTPPVTTGDPESLQDVLKSVIDGLASLTAEPRKIRTADLALLRNAWDVFDTAVSIDRNNRTAAA